MVLVVVLLLLFPKELLPKPDEPNEVLPNPVEPNEDPLLPNGVVVVFIFVFKFVFKFVFVEDPPNGLLIVELDPKGLLIPPLLDPNGDLPNDVLLLLLPNGLDILLELDPHELLLFDPNVPLDLLNALPPPKGF